MCCNSPLPPPSAVACMQRSGFACRACNAFGGRHPRLPRPVPSTALTADVHWRVPWHDALPTLTPSPLLFPLAALLYPVQVNYRTHSGILEVASSVVDALRRFFPQHIDALERERAFFKVRRRRTGQASVQGAPGLAGMPPESICIASNTTVGLLCRLAACGSGPNEAGRTGLAGCSCSRGGLAARALT